MDSAKERLNRNLALAERAVDLAEAMASVVLGGPQGSLLSLGSAAALTTSSSAPELSALLRQLGGQIRRLAGHLAAIESFPEPGSETRHKLATLQAQLRRLIELLQTILTYGGFVQEAASLASRRSLVPRRSNIRRTLDQARKKKRMHSDERRALLAAEKQLQQSLARLAEITPEMLLMAHLGMMAMAGFPSRPSTPQQIRRKKRRRRRASPYAPTASLRPAREEEDWEE